MAEITTKIRRWGNSFGIVIPLEVLRRKKINEGEEIGVFVVKKENVLKRTFGKIKFKKSTKQIMKEVDESLYEL